MGETWYDAELPKLTDYLAGISAKHVVVVDADAIGAATYALEELGKLREEVAALREINHQLGLVKTRLEDELRQLRTFHATVAGAVNGG